MYDTFYYLCANNKAKAALAVLWVYIGLSFVIFAVLSLVLQDYGGILLDAVIAAVSFVSVYLLTDETRRLYWRGYAKSRYRALTDNKKKTVFRDPETVLQYMVCKDLERLYPEGKLYYGEEMGFVFIEKNVISVLNFPGNTDEYVSGSERINGILHGYGHGEEDWTVRNVLFGRDVNRKRRETHPGYTYIELSIPYREGRYRDFWEEEETKDIAISEPVWKKENGTYVYGKMMGKEYRYGCGIYCIREKGEKTWHYQSEI